jgi:fructose-1,6-bisphosphatase
MIEERIKFYGKIFEFVTQYYSQIVDSIIELDGGFFKTYQSTTKIAGYSLSYNSKKLVLVDFKKLMIYKNGNIK